MKGSFYGFPKPVPDGKWVPNNAGDVAAVSYHASGTSLHVVPALGYTDGSNDASVITDADHVAANIKAGITDFGVLGTLQPIEAGDVLIQSADIERATTSTTYEKQKDITVSFSGTIRVKFDLKAGNTGENNYGKVYKNDGAVGTERITTSMVYTTYSEDFTVESGDTIELWIHQSPLLSGCYCALFRIYINIPTTVNTN